MPAPVESLFVYGSLLSGLPNAGLLGTFHRRPATAPGRLYRQAGGYPVLVYDPEAQPIQGELVDLDQPGVLRVLDLFEGVPELYRRTQRTVFVGPNQAQAWIYELDAAEVARRRLPELPVRDWRRAARTAR